MVHFKSILTLIILFFLLSSCNSEKNDNNQLSTNDGDVIIIASEKIVPFNFYEIAFERKESPLFEYLVMKASNQTDYEGIWNLFGLKNEMPSIDFNEKNILFIGGYESGSCPLKIDDISTNSDTITITLRLAMTGEYIACTADATPRTFVIEVDKKTSQDLENIIIVESGVETLVPISLINILNNSITDPFTKLEVEVVENISPDMLIVEYRYDGMSRGNLEYFGKLVVDPNYYNNHKFQRGDVVYVKSEIFKNQYSDEPQVLRIVGLSGEEIHIKQAQVYVDGKRLDTFYGEYHHAGLNYEQFYSGDPSVKVKDSWEYDEVLVPENLVYLLGDDWFRSGLDSKNYGPIPIEHIVGKVLGYETKPRR